MAKIENNYECLDCLKPVKNTWLCENCKQEITMHPTWIEFFESGESFWLWKLSEKDVDGEKNEK